LLTSDDIQFGYLIWGDQHIDIGFFIHMAEFAAAGNVYDQVPCYSL
jgi:hypothetical protein